MSNSIALVAGEGTGGFRDGDFTSAFFKKPLGLALSPDGTRLFVADSANNRIREIHLDQNNKVTTLVGQENPGSQNGSLASASFKQPQGVVALPEERLVVNDFGNKFLRLVDMKSKTVSTLTGTAFEPVTASIPSTSLESEAESTGTQVSMARIRDMVYLPTADSLFFSQPDQGTLKRLDLKTGQVTLVLHNRTELPHPAALCGSTNMLYVADRDLNQVFQFDWKNGTEPALVPAGKTLSKVLALAINENYLYAIQAGSESPLMRLAPQIEPVTFVSAWGNEIPNSGVKIPSIINLNPEDPIGFVPDPLDGRKFYFVNPTCNIVTSFRELFTPSDGALGYPAHKPPRTFRILFVGDSRSAYISSGPNTHPVCISERMGLELNTLAVLDDVPMNFEVLTLYKSASIPLFLWPTYEVPAVVQNYDIDLVIILHPPTPTGFNPYAAYFERPITQDGIPANQIDPEYLLKPPLLRIPDGPARNFFDLCKAHKLVRIEKNNIVFNYDLDLNPEIRDTLVQLYGKSIDLLKQKLSVMKTTSGQPVQFLVCFTPTAFFRACLLYSEFWKDLTARFHVPFLNLTDEMTALRFSYLPMSEGAGNDHFDSNGHFFFGRLMAHDLIRDGLIPWTKSFYSSEATLLPVTVK